MIYKEKLDTWAPSVVFIAMAALAIWFIIFSPKTPKAAKVAELAATPVCEAPALTDVLDWALNEEPRQTEFVTQSYMLALSLYQANDFEKSFAMLDTLSEIEDINSIMLLADHYRRGAGVVSDMNRTAELYQMAADQGALNGAYALAGLLTTGGENLERDLDRARALYETAAAGGYAPAIEKLKSLSEETTAEEAVSE